MLWCELHQNLGMKGGITNFDASEYERDLEHLQNISQVSHCQNVVAAVVDCCLFLHGPTLYVQLAFTAVPLQCSQPRHSTQNSP